MNTFKVPLVYNICFVSHNLFQLTRDNNEFPTSLCLFVSELTLKTVFWEKSRKFVTDLKKRDEPPKIVNFGAFARSRKTPVPNIQVEINKLGWWSYFSEKSLVANLKVLRERCWIYDYSSP